MSDRMSGYYAEAAVPPALKMSVPMLIVLSAVGASVGVLLWAYYPGFPGPFLFDDAPNLQSLSLIGGEVSWQHLKDYLNTGVAGPVGRPLSLLSFLLNATDWPAQPWPFKYTNVLIHALNSLLVFWFTLLIVRRVNGASTAGVVVAGLVSMLWAFNPYHVSTVLYVVQRMAMLSAMFVLLGLILYFKGRIALEARSRPRLGMLLIITAYVVGAGLGVLSKENAALFVLMVPLVEWLFFSGHDRSLPLRAQWTVRGMVAVPALLFVVAMIFQWPALADEYRWSRAFTLEERLLTQTRAVGYYLWRYLVPGTDYVGIYGDGFEKSTGLLAPASTMIWVLIHAVLIALAVKVRRITPLLSFGILFFYVAHLMESSVVPLELFFEHRNYLPSAFLFASIVAVLAKKPVVMVVAALLSLNVFLLHKEAQNWADPLAFRALQVERNPTSEWAAQDLAVWHFNQRNYARALGILRSHANRARPGMEIALRTVLASCYANDEAAQDKASLLVSPTVYPGKPGSLLKNVDMLSFAIRRGVCQHTTFQDLLSFLEVFREVNHDSPKALQTYYAARGIVALHVGSYLAFRDAVIEAVGLYPSAEYTLGVCSHLAQVHREDACACLQRGGHAFLGDVGVQRSLTRKIFGYAQSIRERAEYLRTHVCALH